MLYMDARANTIVSKRAARHCYLEDCEIGYSYN